MWMAWWRHHFFTENENVNLQVRLIQARPRERQIWMQSFGRAMKNVLSIYSDVAQAIARESNIVLKTTEKRVLKSSGQVIPEAYEAYLKGMNHWEKLTEPDLDIAMGYFQKSRETDPEYALAYSGMANVWLAHMQQGFKPKHEAMPRMEEAAKKALEIDENIAEVHSLLAGVKCNHYWDWEGAGIEYNRVFEINPNHAMSHSYYSHYLAIIGAVEEGLKHAQFAIRLDPFCVLYKAVYAAALKNARKYDEAHIVIMDTLDKEPNDRIALPALWTLYHKLEKYDEAIDVAKRIYKAKGYNEAYQLIEQYEKEEDYVSIMLRLAKLMIDRRVLAYVTPFQIATLFTRGGNAEKAIQWLEKAFEARDPNMIYINIDPLFDGLRENQNFQNILRLMKFPPQ